MPDDCLPYVRGGPQETIPDRHRGPARPPLPVGWGAANEYQDRSGKSCVSDAPTVQGSRPDIPATADQGLLIVLRTRHAALLFLNMQSHVGPTESLLPYIQAPLMMCVPG